MVGTREGVLIVYYAKCFSVARIVLAHAHIIHPFYVYTVYTIYLFLVYLVYTFRYNHEHTRACGNS